MSLVIVGTTNPGKIEAVLRGFNQIWPNTSWEVQGLKANSGVANQPLDPVESIVGAKNRAREALESNPEAVYGVGLEGGLEKVDGMWFDCGWCVIIDRKGGIGISSSARIPTPESMMKLIHDGKELGEVIDILFHTHQAKHNVGHFGLMTNGAVTRIDGYVHAVCFALSRFLHPELF